MADISERHESIDRTQDTSTYRLNYEEVQRQFDQLNPGPINVACSTWSRVANNLGTLANQLLADAGQKLILAWESDTSPDAQRHLQVAQATAHALADQCMQMARATDTAYRYADWYKANVPGDGVIPTGADSQRAVDHLGKMLSRYNEVIGYIVPPEVRVQYVETKAKDHTFRPTGGGGGAGAGGVGTPHPPGGVGAGGAPHLPDGAPAGSEVGGSPLDNSQFGDGAGGPQFGGPAGSGTGAGTGHLPGTGGAGGLGGPYDAGSALAGSGVGSGIDSGLGGPGAGSGIGSGGIGGGPGSGLGGGPGSAGGVAGGAPGSLLAGGRGGAGRGGGGLAGGGAGAGGSAAGRNAAPMHGGGEGGDEEERQRSTWLTEDEDVWGGATNAPPPVIDG
jgi:hypothetical protein